MNYVCADCYAEFEPVRENLIYGIDDSSSILCPECGSDDTYIDNDQEHYYDDDPFIMDDWKDYGDDL